MAKKKELAPVLPQGPTSIIILGNEYRAGDPITVVTPEFGAMSTCVSGMKYNAGSKPYGASLGWVFVSGKEGAFSSNHGTMSISGFEEPEPDNWWQQRGYSEFWCEIYLVIFFGGIHLGRSETKNKDGFYPDLFGPNYPRHWPTVFNRRCKPAGHLLMAEGPAYRVDNKWIGHNQWESMINPQPVFIERPLPIEKPKPAVQLRLF